MSSSEFAAAGLVSTYQFWKPMISLETCSERYKKRNLAGKNWYEQNSIKILHRFNTYKVHDTITAYSLQKIYVPIDSNFDTKVL